MPRNAPNSPSLKQLCQAKHWGVSFACTEDIGNQRWVIELQSYSEGSRVLLQKREEFEMGDWNGLNYETKWNECAIVCPTWLWCYMMLYDAIWCYMMLYDAIWCYMMLYDAIWCYIMLYSRGLKSEQFSWMWTNRLRKSRHDRVTAGSQQSIKTQGDCLHLKDTKYHYNKHERAHPSHCRLLFCQHCFALLTIILPQWFDLRRSKTEWTKETMKREEVTVCEKEREETASKQQQAAASSSKQQQQTASSRQAGKQQQASSSKQAATSVCHLEWMNKYKL